MSLLPLSSSSFPTKDPLAGKRYDIVVIDPPWSYSGDPNKMGAAGKHYNLMSDQDIQSLPLKNILKKNAFVFVWATGPKLHLATETIKKWGLHYRGVAHVWVKCRKFDKAIIHGQGVPPTYSKPTTEMLLVATTKKTGRPVKLLSSKLPQVILAPREGHSTKPEVFRKTIETAFGTSGNLEYLEVFGRKPITGWDVIGNGVRPNEDIRDTLEAIIDK